MPIVQDGDPVLRAKAAAVAKSEFGSAKLAGVVRDMAAALNAEEDAHAVGVALCRSPDRNC